MAEVIWSPAALVDLDEITAFIARDSPEHAESFARRLKQSADRLQRFPASGRVIKDMWNPNRREIIVGSYRLMYALVGNDVWITGIVHGARDR